MPNSNVSHSLGSQRLCVSKVDVEYGTPLHLYKIALTGRLQDRPHGLPTRSSSRPPKGSSSCHALLSIRDFLYGSDGVIGFAKGNAMSVEIDHEFSVRPEVLWAIVGVPDRVDWVPGVTHCNFDGEVRSLSLPGAGAIKERILQLDDAARTIEYTCFESPGGLEHHHARMTVVASEQGCRLLWQASVKPEAIEPFIQGSMEGCMTRLEALVRDE